jgi:hypothetical protein
MSLNATRAPHKICKFKVELPNSSVRMVGLFCSSSYGWVIRFEVLSNLFGPILWGNSLMCRAARGTLRRPRGTACTVPTDPFHRPVPLGDSPYPEAFPDWARPQARAPEIQACLLGYRHRLRPIALPRNGFARDFAYGYRLRHRCRQSRHWT